ncbi:hypothetical protein QOL99_00310 [Deinococcus sp. MIMF12]|uniref:DUF952 domain-containing protein n=1 Tax=Deinococcus rhizophilus TaxID=3049544 RepID=A0ABT7JC28_9DEIO|nr:hypothetical protein [Deinococcus rhizophilus]MDL2342591.1 hypothetical protein [Deinococcus rhizophilus]
MDYLQARNARGFLHASTCDWPEGFGEEFRCCMEAQGMTVTRYSPEQLAALRCAPVLGEPQAPEPQEAAAAGPSLAPERPLPEIGQEVLSPVLGRATVTHYLTWADGSRAAVVESRRGAGLVRPGEWEAAPEQESTPAPEAAVPTVPPVSIPPGQCVMPSLFDFGAQA